MEVDPEKRLSAQQALDHPWLKNKLKNKFDVNAASEAVNNLKEFRVSYYSKLTIFSG